MRYWQLLTQKQQDLSPRLLDYKAFAQPLCYYYWPTFFKDCPGRGARMGSSVFFVDFISLKQRLRPLGYCATTATLLCQDSGQGGEKAT